MALDFLQRLQNDKPHADGIPRRLLTPWGAKLNPARVLPEYPRPQFQRGSFYSLNGIWEYAVRTDEEIPRVPDGKILVPFSPESRLSGVGRVLQPGEFFWYMTNLPKLRIPSPEHRLLLHFGAVDQVAEVYVNSILIHTHVGGYLPFTLDITDALSTDIERTRLLTNDLSVRVQDDTDASWHTRGKQSLEPGGNRYAAQSGIWQSVWLEWTPKAYIQGIKIVPEDNLEYVRIQVNTTASLPVSVKIFRQREQLSESRQNAVMSRAEHNLYPSPDLRPANSRQGNYHAIFRIYLPNAQLWSPEHPFLYVLRLQAGEDELLSYFAMRTYTIERDARGYARFCLNHKPYFLNGVMDQGHWPDGLMTAPADEALAFDITEMKRQRFNMLRKHGKIESMRWYYHCDRIGMIVWQDMVNGGAACSRNLTTQLPSFFSDAHRTYSDGAAHYKRLGRSSEAGRKQWMREMLSTISLLFSAPCVATWVLFHEGWGQFDANDMTAIARQMDPTRPIDQASGWFDQGGGSYRSIHAYGHKLEADTREDGRAFVLSAYGGLTYCVKEHSAAERSFGYRTFSSIAELNMAYQELVENELGPLMLQGLSGAIYTQVSDVAEEMDGILTYDRRIRKIQPPSDSASQRRFRRPGKGVS